MQITMAIATPSGLVLSVSFHSMHAKFHHKVVRVRSASELSGARKQDGLNLNLSRSQSQPSRERKGGHDLGQPQFWKKRDHELEDDAAAAKTLHVPFETFERFRILAHNDDVVESHAVTELETWQLRKLAAAAELGPQFVNVDALAAEVGLSKSEVLAWSGTYTEDHLTHVGEIDSYMEDVTIIEEVEKPAKHVPARPISEREMDMQRKVEDLMYTLKDVIPGQLADIFADKRRWKPIVKHFSENMDFQNPLFCLQGRNRFLKWFQSLGQAGVFLNLHDIYYENIFTNKNKRWVTAVWTVSSTHEIRTSSLHLMPLSRIHDSQESDAFKNAVDCSDSNHKDGNISGSTHGADDYQNLVTTPKIRSDFEMSGETNFEMDDTGLVTQVYTKWYRTAKVTEESFMKSKMWLAELLTASFSEVPAGSNPLSCV